LGNGAREFMILLPSVDAAKAWQMQDNRSRAESFQLGSNILLYAVEKQNLKFKGETHVVQRDPTKASKSAKVARLEYAGNWNPEPGGWQRLSNLLHNNKSLDLNLEPVKLGSAKLDSSFKIAHLTGTAGFKLNDAQRGEIKKFVDGGGTLIVDACGGSSAFGQAAEAELAAIFPEGRSMTAIDKKHASLADAGDLELRKAAVKVLGKSRAPTPKGIESNGKIRVFYSPIDLSTGMVGQPIDGVAGYSPESATDLMRSIVLYASR
jgi:hypothetical protein